MNGKMKRLLSMLLLPLLFAVLLVPKQAFAEGYSCSASIPVEVSVSGDKIPSGVNYKIILEAVTENAPMPEKAEGAEETEETSLVIQNGGKGEFGPMTYTVPGDYQYRVYQEDGKVDRFTYDSAVYTVTVRVVNDDDGGLKAEVWAVRDNSTEKADNVRFSNSYKAPEESKKHHHSSSSDPQPAPQEASAVNAAKTGDSANVILWVSLMAVAVLAVIVVLFRKRRRKEED